MKKWVLVLFVACVASVEAETVWFSTSTEMVTTGQLLGDATISDQTYTTNVQEVAGLEVSIRTGVADHFISSDSKSLGINAPGTGDEASRLELGEIIYLSFSKEVEITSFDFRYFESGESFAWIREGKADFIITSDDLDSGTTDTIQTNLVLEANEWVALQVSPTEGSNIALESLDIELVTIPAASPVVLSITHTNLSAHLSAEVLDTGFTSYQLEACSDLISNDWSNVAVPFDATTNWVFSANESQFYRVVESL